MRVGIDFHGCIDLYPSIFSNLSHNLHRAGNGVYIITGQEASRVIDGLKKYKIYYDQILSTVDYHLSIGTKMWQDEKQTWWMDRQIWLKSKSVFIKDYKIDLHFDDQPEYAEFCNGSNTTFILVPKKGFEKFASQFLME